VRKKKTELGERKTEVFRFLFLRSFRVTIWRAAPNPFGHSPGCSWEPELVGVNGLLHHALPDGASFPGDVPVSCRLGLNRPQKSGKPRKEGCETQQSATLITLG